MSASRERRSPSASNEGIGIRVLGSTSGCGAVGASRANSARQPQTSYLRLVIVQQILEGIGFFLPARPSWKETHNNNAVSEL